MKTVKTWSDINIEQMKTNVSAIDTCVRNGMSVKNLIYANAYSFSPVPVFPRQGVCPNYLAVKTIEDGCKLRELGVNYPILICDYPKPYNIAEYVRILISHCLTQSVDNDLTLKRLASRTIPAYGGVPAVHLKVDISGDTAGYSYYDSESDISELAAAKTDPGIYCEGIYTELSVNDTDEKKRSKIIRLNDIASKLERLSKKPFLLRHVMADR